MHFAARASLKSRIRFGSLAAILCCLGSSAYATSVPPRTLEEIVDESDHVLVAKVVKVDMVNGFGFTVTDKKARTGPGLRNRIRFHLEVQDVRFTTCKRQPRRVLVPLWPAWHYTLGAMQEQVEGSTGIFLLKGPGFEPSYPAFFQRSLDEGKTVFPLADRLRLKRKQSQLDCREDRSFNAA